MPHFISATRIQLVCPCGNSALYRATVSIIALLLDEREIQQWGGLTYSSVDSPTFVGKFWDDQSWEEDHNVLIFVDAPRKTFAGILTYFAQLRDLVNEVYAAVGQPQKALWITAQSIRILQD